MIFETKFKGEEFNANDFNDWAKENEGEAYQICLSITKKISKTSWDLIQAMDQYQDKSEGYRNGSASISEALAAGDDLGKAKSELWNVLKGKQTTT